MGVWGTGIFENDDSLDWIYDFADFGSLARISAALDVIIRNKDEFPELSDCRIALAAAEIIAAMHGDPSLDLPEEAEEWIGDRVLENEYFRTKAEDAVARILRKSELREKWESSLNFDKWQIEIQNLQKRLEI
jgi:hypothetical protein